MAKNIFKKFIKNTFNRDKSVIGIDIGSAFLKVVQIRKKKNKAVLETYGELALGPYAGVSVGQATNLPPTKIAEAMQDLMKEANITANLSGVAMPLSASLLSLIEMPLLSEKQLAKMIPIEARKYIPVPITEVTMDWWTIPKEKKTVSSNVGDNDKSKDDDNEKDEKEKQQKTDVLVVSIHNEVINKYKEILKNSGVDNNFFELEIFSTIRSTFGSHMKPVAVLDMGAASTRLSVVEYGIIRSQHVINRGSQDITMAISQATSVEPQRAEELKREFGLKGTGVNQNISDSSSLILGNIFSEAGGVLMNYQRRYGKNIQSIVLTGGGALLKGLYVMAKQNFETEVVYADPFSKIEAPAVLDAVLKDAGPEFSVAVGVALRRLQELE